MRGVNYDGSIIDGQVMMDVAGSGGEHIPERNEPELWLLKRNLILRLMDSLTEVVVFIRYPRSGIKSLKDPLI